ncbi:uncharacterized protein LOC122008350 [Zingiber officinale]|uniref:uncharacterized protein LOC122008350 n=1 Tax=Zingiber officinale TaxID=94328 RepID=UPI001C4A78BD|nr:uncharacterized protein LOC122008350 [Zingiber officinale]XP_042420000.1 uncharacterized protein LOC122008350 [Zingiber officinale]
MAKSKAVALTFAERCKNIVAVNWQAHLNTIKADAKGSKQEIYTSKVHYISKRGKPYIWVQESDLHNMNAIIDERASLSVSSIIPGPLTQLLKSLKKFPARVALTGDIKLIEDDKAQVVVESLAKSVVSEHETVDQSSYSVSSLLSAAGTSCGSRSEHLQWLLKENSNYNIYKFNIRSCSYLDGNGGAHDVELNEVEVPKVDRLLPFSEKIIDGINQSQARRRALMLFCLEYYNTMARDAFILSIDHKGFDILAKVTEGVTSSSVNYRWKEFRFTFKEEAQDMEAFCNMLVELEEEALRRVKTYSGLG